MLSPKPKSERNPKIVGRTGRPRISEEIRDKVVKMYDDDVLIRVIAKRCKISEASVFRILDERRKLL